MSDRLSHARSIQVTTLGALLAVRWLARNPTAHGRTEAETLAAIARIVDRAYEREVLL